MRRLLNDYGLLAAVAGSVIAIDQWTKYLVRTNLALGETWMPWEWLAPYARIVHWKNTGIAFGMFQDRNPIFVVLALAVSLAIIYYYPRVEHQDKFMRIALALQLGGALGNVIDRIFIGYVVDFVSVWTLPVINVADSCISIGVVLLVLGIWIQDRNEKRQMENQLALQGTNQVESPLDAPLTVLPEEGDRAD